MVELVFEWLRGGGGVWAGQGRQAPSTKHASNSGKFTQREGERAPG